MNAVGTDMLQIGALFAVGLCLVMSCYYFYVAISRSPEAIVTFAAWGTGLLLAGMFGSVLSSAGFFS